MSKPDSQANVSGPEINCLKESRKFNHPVDRFGSTYKVADIKLRIWWSNVALFQGYIDLRLGTAWLTELTTEESSGGPATRTERHRRQDKTGEQKEDINFMSGSRLWRNCRLRLFPSPRRLFKCQASKSGKGLDRNKITSWWDYMTTFPFDRK